MRTRQAEEHLAARKTVTMPADAVPLTEGPREALVWVLKGGLTPEQAQNDYGMRWHEATRRVLIPVHHGIDLIGILGRAVFGERPKYRMLGGPADTIYRLPHRANKATVVVEDILSAIAVWRAGYNALAVLGTSITPVQAAEIAAAGSRVIGWFDGDNAGDAAWSKLRGRMALHPVRLTRIRTSDDPKRLHRAHLLRLLAQHTGT
jgi:DNA primase